MIQDRICIPPKTKVLIEEKDTGLHDSKRKELTWPKPNLDPFRML
jgi:hypothetical protein